jgi:two-component system OmpR family response regulator
MQILIVEDERRMAALLRSALAEEGHQVIVSSDGATALDMALSTTFDLILLDLMLPQLDGFAVAQRLRGAHNQTPILILTARDTDADTVKALDLGADDYLTKPFSFEVLLARIRAVGRRGQIPQPVPLAAGDVILDSASRRVSKAGRQVNLTPREYSLLELLLRHKGRVVTREHILQAVWGYHSMVEENTVKVFIRLLRNKIEPPGNAKLIHTVRGIGYTLREPE